MSRSAVAGRALLLFASLCLSLVIGELALRLSGLDYNPSPEYHYAPGPGWVHNRGHAYEHTSYAETVEVAFNRAGYRDLERESARPAGVRRVVMVGDSFTAALEVNLTDTFAWRLGELLNERTADAWEVINLGVGDYGTAQELITLEQVGLAYEPDVVVHQVFPLNDICNNSIALAGLCMSRKDRVRPYFVERDGSLVRTTAQPVRNFLRRNLLLYRVIERAYLARVEGIRPGVSREEYARQVEQAGLPPLWPLLYTFVEGEEQIGPVAAGWAMTERLITSMAESSRAAGAHYLPLVLPFHHRIEPNWERYLSGQPPPPQSLDYPERRLAALFEGLGADSVMMRPEFERRPDRFAPHRSGHLNPWAHERTAEALYASLVASGVAVERPEARPAGREGERSYTWGEQIDFGEGGNAGDFLGGGWGEPEGAARWSVREEAVLELPGEVPRWGVLLRAKLEAFLLPGVVDAQRVLIRVDGRLVDTWEIGTPGMHERLALLEPDVFARGERTRIAFELPRSVAPAAVGAGSDSRRLGIAVSSLAFEARGAHVTFRAEPNPIRVCDGIMLGETKISWEIEPGSTVEVRVGAPDGLLFALRGATGYKVTDRWVRDGTRFYLQNRSGELPLTLENTLAILEIELTQEGCGDEAKAEAAARADD